MPFYDLIGLGVYIRVENIYVETDIVICYAKSLENARVPTVVQLKTVVLHNYVSFLTQGNKPRPVALNRISMTTFESWPD